MAWEARIQLTREGAFDLHRALEMCKAKVDADRPHPGAGPAVPPPPLCPECGGAIERAAWEVIERPYGDAVHLDIQPCGHRFRAEWEPLYTPDGGELRWP